MTSDAPQTPSQNNYSRYSRFKAAALFILIAAVGYILITRALNLVPDQIDSVADLLPVRPTDTTIADNNAVTVEPVSWEGAAIDTINDELTLNGIGTSNLTVDVFLDDESVGKTIIDDDGQWELIIPLREPGNYNVRVQLLDDNQVVLGESGNRLEIPVATADVVPVPDPEPTKVAIEQEDPVDLSDGITITSTAINTDVDLATFAGGILTLSGNSVPKSEVELVVADSNSEYGIPLTTNESGDWSLKTVITATADYTITMRDQDETIALLAFTIEDEAVYATGRNCLAGIPPFGTIKGNQYIVAQCEYLTLIAERLNVDFYDLVWANPQLEDIEHLYPTQPLNIP